MRSGRRPILLAAFALAVASLAGSAGAGETVHEVGEGHSLWSIARRYGVSVAALREKNGLKESDPIRPGQKLEIPNKGSKAKTRRADADTEKSKAGEKAKVADEKSDTKSQKDEKDEKESSTRGVSSWVTAKPPQQTQTQKTAKDRGINPCNTPDNGFGVYDRWSRDSSIGQLIIPQRGGVTPAGQFDVMFHFHGHEPVRKEWVRVMDGAVLVGIDLGIGSGPYGSTFSSPEAFKRLVDSVEQAVARKTGKKSARVRKVGLSAWSAGYGAVQEIISQPLGKKLVDVVVLLDGLHSGYSGNMVNETQIKPFIEFAQSASRSEKFMFVSHSSIIPPGYASTTETANFLIYKVGGRPKQSQPRGADPMGLDLISRFSRGKFHVRGYSGNDKMDHCAHIGLFRDVLKVHVKPRWKSPRGSARPGAKPPEPAAPSAPVVAAAVVHMD
jgi:LysM repeat protein